MTLKDLAFSQEPAAYVALGNAILILAVSFGLPLTTEQKTAIDAVLALAAGVLIRSQVSPVAPPPAPAPPATTVG